MAVLATRMPARNANKTRQLPISTIPVGKIVGRISISGRSPPLRRQSADYGLRPNPPYDFYPLHGENRWPCLEAFIRRVRHGVRPAGSDPVLTPSPSFLIQPR